MSSSDNTLPLKATRSLIYTACLAFVLIAIYVCWFYFLKKQPLSSETAAWGSFGDFIGGIANPIVALVALYWLTQSIAIQKQELHETRNVLEEQARSDLSKRFEDTFFALVREHSSLLSQLQNASEDRLGVLDVRAHVFNRSANIHEASYELSKKDLVIGHYFRLLYQIMKFIALKCPGSTCRASELRSTDSQSRPSDEEKFYSNILRSALDARTSQLLAINCYSPGPSDSYFAYRRLIERYAFLEHMPFKVHDKDPSPILLETYSAYDATAFGSSDYVEKLRLLGCVS